MSTSITVNGDRFINDAYDRIGKCLGTLQLNANGSWFQRNEYLWLDDQPIAQVVTSYGANNTVTGRRLTYIHTDHLNTPRLMTDAGQTIVWRWDRDAFGFHNSDENPDGLAPSDRLDLRLPGQIRDVNSGLYYNYYRDYDPASGRYMQSDPIGLAGGLNTYLYAEGNPTSRFDPLGLQTTVNSWCSKNPTACANALGWGSTSNSGSGIGTGAALGAGAAASSQETCPPDAKDKEKSCDEQLKRDNTTCRAIQRSERQGKRQPGAARNCYASAMERYGNCLAGRPTGPLNTWNN